jgi:CRP-like cAMP-binding protein
MISLEQSLTEHPFLKGLQAEYIQYVIEYAHETDFESGEDILHEGKEADQFYFISQGKVALGTYIPARGFATIQTLEGGEILGWSWLIPPHKWRFNAKAITPTSVIVVDGKQLRQKCEDDPEFGYELLKRLALVVGQRLTNTRMRLEV